MSLWYVASFPLDQNQDAAHFGQGMARVDTSFAHVWRAFRQPFARNRKKKWVGTISYLVFRESSANLSPTCTFLERYLSRRHFKSMPVDLDHIKPSMGFCTTHIYIYILAFAGEHGQGTISSRPVWHGHNGREHAYMQMLNLRRVCNVHVATLKTKHGWSVRTWNAGQCLFSEWPGAAALFFLMGWRLHPRLKQVCGAWLQALLPCFWLLLPILARTAHRESWGCCGSPHAPADLRG